ncbi:hypothetical protein HGB24_01330 [Candidatus Saccharibacteria bacterium]|nr:hypothetical protein [Candidatus Saccharibacteria bacterium]
MSQVFDRIHKEISDYKKDQEKRREIAKKSIEEALAEDRAILNKSGVKEIFEEIRKSGLVKLRSERQGKKTGFWAKLFSEDEAYAKPSELDYVPAEIIDNGYSISLRFDEGPDGCSEIRIAVIGGELNVAHGYNRVDYTPIGPGEIADAIVDSIKNPLRINNDSYIE